MASKEPLNEILRAVVQGTADRFESKKDVFGLSTGHRDLDFLTTGLQPGMIYAVTGRPSVGKTAFVLDISRRVSVEQEKCVLFFSTEQSEENLATALLAQQAKVDGLRIRQGRLTESDWVKFTKAAGALSLSESRLSLHCFDWLPLSELEAILSDKAKNKSPASLMVIDKFHSLIFGDTCEDGAQNRSHEQFKIVVELRRLARTYSLPIVVTVDLNKATEARPDRRGFLHDMKDPSASIESYADVVLSLHREMGDDPSVPQIAECSILKNRHAIAGTIRIIWLGPFGTFETLAAPQK